MKVGDGPSPDVRTQADWTPEFRRLHASAVAEIEEGIAIVETARGIERNLVVIDHRRGASDSGSFAQNPPALRIGFFQLEMVDVPEISFQLEVLGQKMAGPDTIDAFFFEFF